MCLKVCKKDSFSIWQIWSHKSCTCPHALSKIIIALVCLQHVHWDSLVLSETINKPIASGCSSFQCRCLHIHAFTYVCNALLYIYCMCLLCLHKCEKHLCQDYKINTLHNAHYIVDETSCILYTFLKMSFFQPQQLNKATVRCGRVSCII